MGNLSGGSSVTTVVVNRRGGGDSGGGGDGDGGGGEFELEKFDGNQDGTMDASELTAIRRARGEVTSDRLKVFDEDGDGRLDHREVRLAKGSEELFNRVYVLRALAQKYRAATTSRVKYWGILSHLLFMAGRGAS